MLEDSEGTFRITKPGTEFEITYELALSNRKVLSTKTVEIDGQSFQAYQVSYNLSQKNATADVLLSTSSQTVTDWFVPELGIIERTRTGSVDRTHAKVELDQKTTISRKF